MPATRKLRVTVGMSGGVDSSVAALLLQQRGYDVHGLFMKNWEEDDHDGHCAAAQDYEDVAQVCRQLDIPLRTVNFSSEYWDRVFQNFLSEYQAGRTPNPDVLCNREIKFSAFLDHALDMGADYIATGHYARIARADGDFRLLKGRDRAKDQSYFLYALDQRALAHTLFPVGDMNKSDLRALAATHGLVTHAKKDSTGICFIGERRFRDFLRRYVQAPPGEIRTPEGAVVGTHQGLVYYTLGQREGLGIGGIRGAAETPWYVVAKDLARNALIVAQGHDHPLLFHTALEASALHWVAGCAPRVPLHCHAKNRYRQADQACVITESGSDRCRVVFEQPQRALTPGQSVVFYQGETCLGGGIIERAAD